LYGGVIGFSTCRSERTGSTHQSDESLDSENTATAAASVPPTPAQSPQSNTAKGFLLRLFESKLFDMSMAITYLFNSKEPGVQSYIGQSCFNVAFLVIGRCQCKVVYVYFETHFVLNYASSYCFWGLRSFRCMIALTRKLF
jgi:hypothetical protein